MEFQVFLVFVALSVSMSVSAYDIGSPGEAYWKMNFGTDTNMPKVVKDALLGQQRSDTKTYQANQAYGNEAKAYAQHLSESRSGTVNEHYANGAQAYAQHLSKSRSGTVNEHYANGAQAYAQHLSESRSGSTNQHYAYEAQAYAQHLSELASESRNQHYAYGAQAQTYNSKASKLLTDNSIQFFFEKDLINPRSSMKLHFLMGAQEAKFMSSEVTNSMPFSSSKLPEILKFFIVKPGSQNAKIIEQTITLCESKAMKGEEKACETSLEGMVNYAKSKLGKQIKAVSTEVNKETEQEYQIKSATKINNENNLVCHKMIYPYAVFYCHTLSKTDIYKVSLVDSIGKKIKAVAICHKDTTHWYQEHLAFQLLKVKPGSVPICHFLNVDALVWVPK